MFLARDLYSAYLTSLEEKWKGAKHFVESGFTDLDKYLGGWLHDGHLIVVAARPGMGKTGFTQQVGENIAEKDRSVIFMTLEMSSHEVIERSVCRRARIPIQELKTASFDKKHWPKIVELSYNFNELPFLVDDASYALPALIHKIEAAAAAIPAKGLPPLGCIIVDYLQLVTGKAANRTLEIGQITAALKRLAKTLAVPVVAISQLNRNVETRVDKRPTMSDLRESGNIEQDSDLILFLYRDDYYNSSSPDKGTCEIIASKNRHGPTGMVRMAFVGEYITFGGLSYAS
jgi:replicative DNA helicase